MELSIGYKVNRDLLGKLKNTFRCLRGNSNFLLYYHAVDLLLIGFNDDDWATDKDRSTSG